MQNTEKAAEEDYLLNDDEFFKPMDASKVKNPVPNFDFEESKVNISGIGETPTSSRILGSADKELEPKDNFSEYRNTDDV